MFATKVILGCIEDGYILIEYFPNLRPRISMKEMEQLSENLCVSSLSEYMSISIYSIMRCTQTVGFFF